jgi:hypothetical protein
VEEVLVPAARRRVDRWIATGLAVAACAGLTALIAVRAADPGSGKSQPGERDRAELDAYAEQLTREAARLQSYRQELRRVAAELSRGVDADTEVVGRIAEETGPPGSTGDSTRLERDTSTYSS